MKIKNLIIAMLTLISAAAEAQSFNDFFTDKTLRVNFILGGNANSQNIYISNMNSIDGWYGRKNHLAEFPVEGNTQFELKDKKTGKVIYRNSLSTLFQEWQTYPEAKTSNRSFENVILMPMPKDTATLTISLISNRRQIAGSITETISPTDILIRKTGEEPAPYEVLNKAADQEKCIHIAFLAEGYTDKEMDKFINDARIATDAIFAHEPFKKYQDRFQVIAVKSASEDSGTSVPSKGIWKKTALGSNFDTFYSERYLTTLNLSRVHDCLAGTPYEHIIVLVNTSEYGGGGILNSYNLSMTHHKLFKQVVTHEFGHSFAGLGDEYAYEFEQIPMYPHDIEPWEPNLTTLKDFHGKWEDMLKKGTKIPTPLKKDSNEIGVYEGAGYSLKGVYRPAPDCRMRSNQTPEFCKVCQRALTNLIKFYTE